MSSDATSRVGRECDHPAPSLSLTIVRYADGPDRATVYPPAADGDKRMSTWLSADRSVFVDLRSIE